MVVIYAEKHSLAKTIAAALGAGNRIPNPKEPVMAHWEFDFNGEAAVLCHGSGHLAELAKAREYGEQYEKWDLDKFPCIPDNFKLKEKEKSVSLLKYVGEFMKKADWLINATDPDREGELIFAYVLDMVFGNGKQSVPWKRVILTDLTDETIIKAFKNLKNGKDMIPLQLAGRARDISDWLFGCNLTMAMTKRFGSKDNLLSVGRVQTPTLTLVTEREKAIKNHIKTPFWRVLGYFTTANGEQLTAEHENGRFDNFKEADEIKTACYGKNGIVTEKKVQKKSESAPLLYNATTLLAEAGNKLGWELDKTTKILQSLYENKLMSYPRTSSEHLPVEMTDDVAVTIEKLMNIGEYREYAIPCDNWQAFTKRHFDNEKVGSHTAIIPTTAVPDNLNSLSGDERALYDLLVKSLYKIVYPKAEYEETELIITIANTSHRFKCKGKVTLQKGWKALENNKDKQSVLPEVFKNEMLSCKTGVEEGETEPPKRFTEASLILAMEVAGQKLENEAARELMKLQKKGLGTDATRAAVIGGLFEEKKQYIRKNGKSIVPTEKGMYLINTLTVQSLKSAEMTGEWEKRLNDIAEAGDNVKAEELYISFLSDIKAELKKWYNEIKNSKGEPYYSSDEVKMICPFCCSRIFKGKFGYSCSGYANGCKFQINYEICGKKITEAQTGMLISSGKTAVIKGFKGSNGKAFDAALKLDNANKKINFEFVNGK